MKRPMVLAFTLALLGAASAAQAADPARRKPGLWEVQSATQGGSMPGGAMPDMDEAMRQMSPQQRAMVEKMMKERGVGAGAQPHSFRYCLSKERAERDFVPQTDPDTECSHTMSSTSASEAKFSFSCKRKDGSTVQGDGRAYGLSPESYAMDMRMKMQHEGKPMEMTMQQKGKWLGSDCKGLKPLGG